jgi:hypothetical protein
MFSRMSHLQGVLQDGDKLLDLVVVQDSSRYPSLRGKPLEQIDPFSPLAIRRAPYLTFVCFDGNRKLIFGNKIKSTFGKNVIDCGQDFVLFSDIKIGGKVEQFSFLCCDRPWGRRIKQLMWSIKFVTI